MQVNYRVSNRKTRIGNVQTTLERAEIKQLGRYELIPNKTEYDFFGYSFHRAIPYINAKNEIQGLQLLIAGGEDKKDGKDRFQVINIMDDKDCNNIIKYQSDIIQYGHQRFYNILTSNKRGVQSFYVFFAAQLDEKFIDQKNLDHCERHIICKTITDQMQSMIEFSFENCMLTNF